MISKPRLSVCEPKTSGSKGWARQACHEAQREGRSVSLRDGPISRDPVQGAMAEASRHGGGYQGVHRGQQWPPQVKGISRKRTESARCLEAAFTSCEMHEQDTPPETRRGSCGGLRGPGREACRKIRTDAADCCHAESGEVRQL